MTWHDEWQSAIASAEWAAAVTGSPRTVSGRVVVIDADDNEITDVPVTSCTVDYDGEQAERWSLTISVTDTAFVPRRSVDPLDPRTGYRVRAYWRLQVATGTWLEVPCGTYWLDDPQIGDDGAAISLDMAGHDAVAHYRRGGYGGRTIDVSGMTVSAALTTIFEALSISNYCVATSAATLPSTYALGTSEDPWDDVMDIATMGGLDVYADRMGVIVAAPNPDPQAVRLDWQEGPSCPVVSLRRTLTTSSIRNRVVATSTNPDVDPPVTAVVQDDDPASLTWVGGRFGVRETRIRSDKIADAEGAHNMASATFERWRRATESLQVQARSRPDLAFRDLAACKSDRSGVTGLWRVRGWRLDLPVPGNTRSQMTVTMQTRTT